MLSIIIPTLNEEKVLEKTLLSLRKLTAIPYELIVSDGGSTDKTLEVAQKYADKVVKNLSGERQNIAIGRNLGAEAASGDLLVFLDADVEIPDINTFFEKALSVFNNHKVVAMTVFLKVFPEHATLADKFFFQLVNTIHYVANNWLKIGSASGEFQMIRAESFKALGGYSVKLMAGEDVEMFSRLRALGLTKIETGLHVLHTSRRAHKIGWAKLWWQWFANNLLFIKLFKRSPAKEWTVIR